MDKNGWRASVLLWAGGNLTALVSPAFLFLLARQRVFHIEAARFRGDAAATAFPHAHGKRQKLPLPLGGGGPSAWKAYGKNLPLILFKRRWLENSILQSFPPGYGGAVVCAMGPSLKPCLFLLCGIRCGGPFPPPPPPGIL